MMQDTERDKIFERLNRVSSQLETIRANQRNASQNLERIEEHLSKLNERVTTNQINIGKLQAVTAGISGGVSVAVSVAVSAIRDMFSGK